MSLKPNSNYKMSSSAKRMLSTILDPHLRNTIKRGTIQAELVAKMQPTRREKNQDKR